MQQGQGRSLPSLRGEDEEPGRSWLSVAFCCACLGVFLGLILMITGSVLTGLAVGQKHPPGSIQSIRGPVILSVGIFLQIACCCLCCCCICCDFGHKKQVNPLPPPMPQEPPPYSADPPPPYDYEVFTISDSVNNNNRPESPPPAYESIISPTSNTGFTNNNNIPAATS